MADALFPLDFPPGIVRNGTTYQSKGRWFDANLVRFVDGTIQPIGGWRALQAATGVDLDSAVGVPRAVITWRGATGEPYIAIGTTQKLYVIVAGALHDITPVGFVPGNVDTSYTTGAGAYGSGAFGAGAFGEGASTSELIEADTWQLDTFGDYLAAVCTSDQKLYVWTGDTSVPAAVPAGAPTSCVGVVATPERFLVALGTSGNVRQLSWPSQETTTDWVPTGTNSAGDFPLTTPGRTLAGRRTRNETLIWTDSDLHTMTYIGGLLVYRFASAGQKCGAISRRSMVTFDTVAMWMGNKNFYAYDGFVQPLPCDVHDYVFSDFNYLQSAKVWAMTVAQYGEVWWFYCSAASTEIDRYVVYNYREKHWNIGKLARTAGCDADAVAHPVMTTPDGKIYEHEIFQNRPAAGPGPGISMLLDAGGDLLSELGMTLATEQVAPYIESGPMEIGNGDRLMLIKRLVPDERTLGDVSATIFTAFYPMSEEKTTGPHMLDNPTRLREKGRQVRIRLEEVRESDWRVGTMRLGVSPSSKR